MGHEARTALCLLVATVGGVTFQDCPACFSNNHALLALKRNMLELNLGPISAVNAPSFQLQASFLIICSLIRVVIDSHKHNAYAVPYMSDFSFKLNYDNG